MNHWIVSLTSESFASMEIYFAKFKPHLFCFFCRRSKLGQIVESGGLEGFIPLVLELQFGFIAIQMLRTVLPRQKLVGNVYHSHLRWTIRCSRPWGPVCGLLFRFQSVMLRLWYSINPLTAFGIFYLVSGYNADVDSYLSCLDAMVCIISQSYRTHE